MVILGITGAIGHGKSTLAAGFAQVEPSSQHLESFEVIAEVITQWQARTTATPDPHNIDAVNNWLLLLPDILVEVVHEQIDPNLLRFTLQDVSLQPEVYDKLFMHIQNLKKNPAMLGSQVTEANKVEFRPILQWLGGYLVMKVDPGIWYRELMRRAEALSQAGIQLCVIGGLRYPMDAEIVRAGGGHIVYVHRPMMSVQDAADPTERQRAQIVPDITVLNNAGIPQLLKVAERLYTDILLGKLRARYAASEL